MSGHVFPFPYETSREAEAYARKLTAETRVPPPRVLYRGGGYSADEPCGAGGRPGRDGPPGLPGGWTVGGG